VECNRSIKFGYFLEKMEELGCDAVATGHYIKNEFNSKNNRWEISAGKDIHKDQTYFLYTLTQEKLQHALFPMAPYSKDEIREIANQNNFKSFAQKRESQGVCFYAEKSHIPFLERHIPEAFIAGDIINIHTQKKVGNHNGVLHFTKGQRARVGGMITPQYVIEIDIEKNTVYIGDNTDLFSESVEIFNLSWTMYPLENNSKIFVKIRHGGESMPALFEYTNTDQSEAKLTFTNPVRSLTSGQSAVFYNNNLLLGGGVMK
jgi:tRNA-specific 2-thiouridylase